MDGGARETDDGLTLFGASPVALAVAELAGRIGFAVTFAAPAAGQPLFDSAGARVEGSTLPAVPIRFNRGECRRRDDVFVIGAKLKLPGSVPR